jgi:superfamily II DNA or RNA helicase
MDKRQEIQKEALDAWISSGKRGTLELITGLGKTKIALDAVKTFPKKAKILFLAEVTDREIELKNEQVKWRCKSYNIDFLCYQSAYKLKNTKWDLVIADEIHDGLTKEYSKFFKNNKFGAIIGLSATVDRKAVVDDFEMVYKGDLLDEIAPVCYSYGIDEGQSDGTARKLDVYVINHKLDIHNKSIEAGNAKNRFMQTEWSAYNYRDKSFKRACFAPEGRKQLMIQITSAARAKLLYTLPSKIEACKTLIDGLPGKTIIFGNSLDALHSITPNVVSSKNSDKKNEKIRSDFDTGKLDVIASFKKLKQGANLVGLDNCIIHSYYSKSKDLIQRIGRLRNNGEVGRIFIFVTFGTQEVKWFNSMFEGAESLNMIPCDGVEDCLTKLKT